MSYLALVSALIAIVGLAFAVTGIRRLWQRRFINAIGLELSGLVFLLLASSSFLLASNLHTYQRLTFEQEIAEVTFERLNEQEYRAEIKGIGSDFQKVVNLKGDEWQLDTQVLDANYRLHRISGRYIDINDEKNNPRSVYSLVQKQELPAGIENENLDLWRLAHKYRDWMNWVDAAYGSAVFLPMTDSAKYSVAISRTGLIARPVNKEARTAVSQWISL